LPQLGILLGVTLVGLSAAGVLAGYLVQREMLAARMEQIYSIVDMARNMAAGLQKEVEPASSPRGRLRRVGKRANTLTYEQRLRYLFATP